MPLALTGCESCGLTLDELDPSELRVALVIGELGEVEHPEIVEEEVVGSVDASEHVAERPGFERVIDECVLVARGRRREQYASLPLAAFVPEVDEVEISEAPALLSLAAVDDVVGVCMRGAYPNRRPGGSSVVLDTGP